MTRTTPMAVLVLAALVVAAPMAAAAPAPGPVAMFGQDSGTPTATPADNSSVAPGEKLSGVVGVQQAEVEGEVAERTYGVKVARANSDEAKAAVVAETLGEVEQRVTELEQRKQTLQEARENGSMSEGEYRAKMATVAAELSTARGLANASEDTARGLPADVLEAKGVNATAIQALQDRAQNLSGPEVAQVAQSIAGKDVGTSMADAAPNDTGGEAAGDQAGAPNGTDGGTPVGPDDGAPNGSDGQGGTP